MTTKNKKRARILAQKRKSPSAIARSLGESESDVSSYLAECQIAISTLTDNSPVSSGYDYGDSGSSSSYSSSGGYDGGSSSSGGD